MFVVQSARYPAGRRDPRVLEASSDVPRDLLEEVVASLSFPRHFVQQPEANAQAADWIEQRLQQFGYVTQRQGDFHNIVTIPPVSEGLVLIGAHYDTTPNTPGADDNASSLAAMLATARAVARHARNSPVMFVAFNREEEELLGSWDFVHNFLPDSGLDIGQVHVLEMVGYCDPKPGAQRLPRGLPVRLVRNTGDFLAVLSNRHSTAQMNSLMSAARTYVPHLPVLGLKIWLGLEKYFRDLRRSDHAPFWRIGNSALMWTDTANFRNPHYHQPSDTPETLDYDFLHSVTQLLIAQTLRFAAD